MRFSCSCLVVGAALVLSWPLVTVAADASKRPADKTAAQVVELFAGMDSGDIEVKVIPKDSTAGTITIKNKTGKPLTIKLPEAFAGVPVLAQGFGGGGGMMGGGGGMQGGGGGGGGQQGFGGGGGGGGMMGGGGGGGMQGGGGGGFFNVAPEKIAKVKIVMVCLDHGKKDPNPRVPYKLIPIESYAKSAEVTEVVKMLSKGQLDQHSAQAAVWHLQNDLSWEKLASKIGAKHLNGSVEPYFTRAQLERALLAAKVATERAETSTEKTPVQSPGEQVASQK